MFVRMVQRSLFSTPILALLIAPVSAQNQAATRGAEIVTKLCASCHATGKSGASQLEKAPPFRDLKKRYPVENLAEALAEGIVTGHNDMPVFQFEPEDVEAILAYLDAIGSP